MFANAQDHVQGHLYTTEMLQPTPLTVRKQGHTPSVKCRPAATSHLPGEGQLRAVSQRPLYIKRP